MYKTILLITLLSFFLTSCCSIALDPTRRISVTAQQSDTEIYIDGYACGTTPLLVELDKTCDHTIIASKPGFQEQEICLRSKRTLRSTSNLITPIAGAAVGTGVGLIIYGTSGYILPFFLAGTVIGGAIGLGLGVAGTATDLYLRSDCDLNVKDVHFDLIHAY